MARNYVKDLESVRDLNNELRNQKDIIAQQTGAAARLSDTIGGIATNLTKKSGEHAKGLKYSEKETKQANLIAKAAKAGLKFAKTKSTKDKETLNNVKKQYQTYRDLGGEQNEQLETIFKQSDQITIQKNLLESIIEKTAQLKNAADEALVPFANMATKMLAMVGFAGGISGIMNDLNSTLQPVGDKFGAIGMQNEELVSNLMSARTEAIGIGQDMGDVVNTAASLNDQFGFSFDKSIDLAGSLNNTAKALGLTNDEGVKVFGILTKIAGMSESTAQDFMKQTALLAAQEGVAPGAVMRDIAQSSEQIAKFTSMTPDNLMKAAIQANKLGLTLGVITQSMEGMLDFQSSLNNEIQASLILGRNLNLQKARELAAAGKSELFAEELTRLVGSRAEFEKLGVFEKRALARALNMEVSQMSKMVNNQEKIRTLGDAISEQDGLEKMIGEESMNNIAKMYANMKQIGAELVEAVGPTVLTIAGGIAKFAKGLSDSKVLLPAIGFLLGAMVTKSLVLAYAQTTAAVAQLAISTKGLALLAIPAIAGTILAGVSQMESYEGLESGRAAMITGGAAIAHQGESITHTEDLRALNKNTEDKLDRIAGILDNAFGFGGNAARQIGNRVGSRIEEIA